MQGLWVGGRGATHSSKKSAAENRRENLGSVLLYTLQNFGLAEGMVA